jgi:hypothetical protein
VPRYLYHRATETSQGLEREPLTVHEIDTYQRLFQHLLAALIKLSSNDNKPSTQRLPNLAHRFYH